MDRPRVSVIIPAWNVHGVLAQCLDSLERQVVPGGFETIVIENASSDGTADVLRRRSDRVRVLWNDRNARYATSNNQGAGVAAGEILFFLNADTELLGSDTLARLADVVEAPGVGIAGPMLVNPDGTLQPSCAAHPTVVRGFLVGSGLHHLLPRRILSRVAPEFCPHDRPMDADWLLGAALAVRADLFRDLGGFWSTEYAEDQDLAYRAQRLGFRVRYDHIARVMHVGNFSAGQQRSAAERAARVARAELTFLRVHYPRPRAAAIRALVGAGYAVRALIHTLLGRTARAEIYRAMARTYAPGRSISTTR